MDRPGDGGGGRVSRSPQCVCVCVDVCVDMRALTALRDVADAALHRHRDVILRQLLLTQCVSAAPSRQLDGRTPAHKVQLPLALNIQSPGREDKEG